MLTPTAHTLLAEGRGDSNHRKKLLRDPVEALWETYMKESLQRPEFLPPSEIT